MGANFVEKLLKNMHDINFELLLKGLYFFLSRLQNSVSSFLD